MLIKSKCYTIVIPNTILITMAEAADGHTIDVGRLSEGWPE